MKPAILVVAFGSTVEQARARDIEPIVERIRQQFPGFEVRLAFTSRLVVKRLRDAGINIPTEEAAFEALAAEGYEAIYVQPLHLTGGQEYAKLKMHMIRQGKAHKIQTVRVGRPLLYYMGQEGNPDDYQLLIDAFIKSLDIPRDQGLLFIGHGGISIGNAAYGFLQFKLLRAGLGHVRVATLECAPYVDDVALPWSWLDGVEPKKIHLHPLLLVAGDHAQHDIFGDEEDSVLNRLLQVGYDVVSYRKGLGEYEAIQNLFVQHVQDMLDDTYGKRSKKRPVIPNIT